MMRALQPARRGAKALACRHLGSPATAPQVEPAAAQPRWLAELGAVRTDWTCVLGRRASSGPQPRRRRRKPASALSAPSAGRAPPWRRIKLLRHRRARGGCCLALGGRTRGALRVACAANGR